MSTKRSHTTDRFSQVPKAEIPRSKFERPHGIKTTFDAGFLIPIFVDEALPGDTMELDMTGFGRLATPIHPFMDNLFIDTFFFAVPNRLLWENWQRFNGEEPNPGDSTDFIMPTMTSPDPDGYAEGSLSDYLSIPTKVPGLEHVSLWHRAYNLIWNEWFRDQNLQDRLPVPTGDGPDDPADFVIQKRGKRHDYFTSALPWPQKGPSVNLPLGQRAPVAGFGFDANGLNGVAWSGSIRESNSDFTRTITGRLGRDGTVADEKARLAVETRIVDGFSFPDVWADLSAATAATINQLRQAFQIQKLYERDARGGTRYTEVVKAHFGVTSPDARLQRPEYLGGGSSPINVNPVAQTSATDVLVSPQGNLAAIGTLNMNKHGFTKSFTEHCTLIGMVCVRADLNYQQGLNRMFSRSTRFDFYWPALAHIGEQAILNKEIFAQGSANPDVDGSVFGYQERYAEYRYKPSVITGQMRSNATTSLDTWHLAQDFANLPALNKEFIEEDPAVDRVIAVPSEPHILFDGFFDYCCTRPMPVYGVPGLIDHF